MFYVPNVIEHRFPWNKCFLMYQTNAAQYDATCRIKDVHRRQELTTDFFKLFQLTILVVTISISRKKNMLTVVSGGSFFKGLDNKIIGFVHI